MKRFQGYRKAAAGILSVALMLSISTAAFAAGDAVVIYSEDTNVSSTAYTSTGKDENALLVTAGIVNLDHISVTRSSSNSTGGDESSFYGVGAAILATGGTTTITQSTITTEANGGAGVFAYGDGVIYVNDTDISTSKDTSGGIHVAGGGTLYATDVTATTQGESSAAIRSDRGGGLLVVNGGEFTSNGIGSPAVYCTATIAVREAVLSATNSEAVCIEGLNSLYLYDCVLSGDMPDSSQNDCAWNVILYQSMSGDSEVGNSTFQMVNGTLTAKNGGMFYTTNTESTIILQNVEIVYADDHEFFLRCTGNANARGWGSTGSNGANCTFTAISQNMEGDVLWDSISTLDFYMTDGSVFSGAVTEITDYGTGSGYANFYIDSGSKWVVTGDSTLTNLYNAGSIVDVNGKPVTIKGINGEVYVQGTSAYTVTVAAYSTLADLSGTGSVTEYEKAQVNTGSQTSGGISGMPGGQQAGEMSDIDMNDRKPEDAMMNDQMPENNGDSSLSKPDGNFFSDVKENDWYYDAVKYIKGKGLMNGTSDTIFDPNTGMNYAMIVVTLARLDGQDTSGGSNWYEASIAWAKAQGLIAELDPIEETSRAQLILMLWLYAGAPDSDFDLSSYDDFDLAGSEATAMRWAVEQGIISGTDTAHLSPQSIVTRAQFAAILMRYCENVGA